MDIMADMGHDEKAAAEHGGDFKFTYKLADMGRFDVIWMDAFFSKNIFISIINLLAKIISQRPEVSIENPIKSRLIHQLFLVC